MNCEAKVKKNRKKIGMKKYIVRVQYIKSADLVWLVKAKNDKDLENIMTREYCNSYDLIEGYEYEQVNNRMFKKKDINLICGNWVGVELMKDNLKKLVETFNFIVDKRGNKLFTPKGELKMEENKIKKVEDEPEEKSIDEMTYEQALDIILSQVDLVESEENMMCKDALEEAIERLRKYENNKIVDDDGEFKETIITGTIRTSNEPATYPICPHCNGHHTKQLFGTGTSTSDKNEYSLHFKCLDCGKEFDKEF